MSEYTVHAVLAGAYKGKDIGERTLLLHATLYGSCTAICGRVKPDLLCDWPEPGEVTCPGCLKKIARLGLTRKPRE